MAFFNSIFNSSNDGVFIREAKLLVLPETLSTDIPGVVPINDGSAGLEQAVVYSSSGSNDDFRITFRVVKNIMSLGAPNTLEVSIYNLTKESKQLLSREATNIALQLGYKEGGVKVQSVGIGGIASVTSQRIGGDIRTTVFAYDGLDGLAQSVSYKAYKGNTTLRKIVSEISKDIKGISSSEENIKIDSRITTGSKGRVIAGRTTSCLDKLAQEYGFNWSIQDGVFKVYQDTFFEGNIYEISSAASTLISATPRIDNIGQVVTTIDIETILDPRIQPGDLVNLKSEVNPTLSNIYQATFVTHIGDTHGDVWQTNIQCVINDKARQDLFIAASANATRQLTG